MTRRSSLKPATMVALALIGLLFMAADGAFGAPYCLLRKPFSPPQNNCFQFYLADTAVAPPRTMAVIGAAGCAVTAYAARQGWELDPTVPGPHATAGAGDSAMAVVSPYFGDAYGCHAAGSSTSGGGAGTGMPVCGTICQTAQTMNQAESRDSSGNMKVEAATIYVMNCPNVGQVYIYAYVNRPGYRAIHPGNWSQPIGGQDFQTCDAAERAATNAPQGANAVLAMDGPPVPDTWGGWDVSPGHIHMKLPNGTEGNYSWDAPPQSISAAGFSLTLTAQAKSVKGDGFSTGIGMSVASGSLSLSPSPAMVGLDPKDGASDLRTITVTVTPAKSYNPGDRAEIKIGAYWGPGVTYRYKVVAPGQ